MATITSAQSGNFNDTATWIGGVVPVAGDIAVAANGHIVDINVNTTVSSITQAGTGRFRIGNGITLTGDVTINAGTIATFGTLECVATTVSTVTGNVSGPSQAINNQVGIFMNGSGRLVVNGNLTATGGNVTNAGAAVFSNVTCTIEINGNVTGNAQYKMGIIANSNATIFINGNVNGGGAGSYSHGVSEFGTLTVVGNVIGGTASESRGIVSGQTSSELFLIGTVNGPTGVNNNFSIQLTGSLSKVNITGNVNGGVSAISISVSGASSIVNITGNVFGGLGTFTTLSASGANALVNIIGNVTSSPSAVAVSCGGASSLVNMTGVATAVNFQHAIESGATSSGFGIKYSGNLIDSPGGRTAIFTRFFRMVNNSGVTQYANDAGFPNGGYVNRVDPSNVTGMPAQSNVRNLLVYGYNNELTGSLVVPPANTVSVGVVYDNGTIGTAQNTAASFLTELAASTDPLAVRLKNVATVQTTGDQIAAAL